MIVKSIIATIRSLYLKRLFFIALGAIVFGFGVSSEINNAGVGLAGSINNNGIGKVGLI